MRGAKGMSYYEDDYNYPMYPPASKDRRFPPKYYQEEEYYYEEQPKYDKRTGRVSTQEDYPTGAYKSKESYKEDPYYDKTQSKYKSRQAADEPLVRN
jgi:hypothetical protein